MGDGLCSVDIERVYGDDDGDDVVVEQESNRRASCRIITWGTMTGLFVLEMIYKKWTTLSVHCIVHPLNSKNLSAEAQFKSKEISKTNVVDDVVNSNKLLYEKDEKPDHCVVIKYVPSVKDSKRAMDEYSSRIFMNGLNTIVLHNTCEDSLLAAPIIVCLEDEALCTLYILTL